MGPKLVVIPERPAAPVLPMKTWGEFCKKARTLNECLTLKRRLDRNIRLLERDIEALRGALVETGSELRPAELSTMSGGSTREAAHRG
jgi:hypothetical protein